jgi:hypothetical protein
VGAVMVDGRVASPVSTRELVIDFLYLDLETCTRCRGTDANLDAALAQVGHVLDAAGVEVSVRKTLVTDVASCCAPSVQATCCEPSQKASCCGEATSGGCGCQ